MATALVRNADVRSFIVRLMVRAGTNQVPGWALNFVLTILQLQTEAIDLAKVLVDADYRCGLWLILSEPKFPPRPIWGLLIFA